MDLRCGVRACAAGVALAALLAPVGAGAAEGSTAGQWLSVRTSDGSSEGIDGRGLLVGDVGEYEALLDLSGMSPTWRAGVVLAFDARHLVVDASTVRVSDGSGRDVTDGFNVQVSDGRVYVFARLVDTTMEDGTVVPAGAQPSDLAAYAALDGSSHDPSRDPGVDRSLAGGSYRVRVPWRVTGVGNGSTARASVTRIVDADRGDGNAVSNPLARVEPDRDAVMTVGGDSVDGMSVWRDSSFLYRMDSGVLSADRATSVSSWRVDSNVDPGVDRLTGRWAVYAARDLYGMDGSLLAAKGSRIGGDGMDSSRFGGDLFTASVDPGSGTTRVEATDLYRRLVNANPGREAAWRAYAQATRIAVSDRVDWRFTATLNGRSTRSASAWTRTPAATPTLRVESWDARSGREAGDRDSSTDALTGVRDGERIVFTVTNTSSDAWFRASDLHFSDRAVVGDGAVTGFEHPSGWDSLLLAPGQSVDVTGRLQGFTQGRHTGRTTVESRPLTECPSDGDMAGRVEAGGRSLCLDTTVTSASDDWSGMRAGGRTTRLAATGAAIVNMVAAMAMATAGGVLFLLYRHGKRLESPPGHGREPESHDGDR
ncbi:LPXTG cell wall anchor domain-containing protein [Bifidobacterium callimiconis]|uniref:Phage tail protein n=1 Tax=Bifidobacterium callimiconis TaxID=2306973 RepID=A0A430FEK0_9BIFI|nr:LPXTG cell wall anchor domain-containing protein [Bifidobacterium callimiconis]RSX51257.1 phage tail protein [Bifidobacterium callimiconis]